MGCLFDIYLLVGFVMKNACSWFRGIKCMYFVAKCIKSIIFKNIAFRGEYGAFCVICI